MSNWLKILYLWFTLMNVTVLQAQDYDKLNQLIESLVENKAVRATEGFSRDELIEELYLLAENPIDINHTTAGELERIPVLNMFQIQSVLDYIHREGKLMSIYELQYVVGFNQETVRQMAPFIQIVMNKSGSQSLNKIKPENLLRYGRNKIFLRTGRNLEKAKGYKINEGGTQPDYLGDMYNIYARYGYNYQDRIHLNFTMDKDAGEEFFKGNNRQGFDFYSGYLQYNGNSWFQKLVIGDYKVNLGQGLTVWSGFDFGKTPGRVGAMKTGKPLDGYSSANESNYFRGVASAYRFNKWDFSLFYSNKYLDANVVGFDDPFKIYSSLQSTGYHRTLAEMANKSTIHEVLAGANISYGSGNYELVVTGIHYVLDGIPEPKSGLYKKFQMLQPQNSNGSLSYRFLLNRFYFYGEGAISTNGGFAFLNGVNYQFSSDIAFAFLHRHYDKEYYARFASGFAENSSTTNEEGFYLGIRAKLAPSLNSVFYMDVSRFSWLRYTADGPSESSDILFQLDYNVNDNTRLYLKIKEDLKEINDDDPLLSGLETQRTSHYRFHFQSVLSDQIRWSNRLEFATSRASGEIDKGWLIYQDIRFQMQKIPLTASIRYTFFDTDSYASRIYAFESDVLYAFAIPAFFSKGSRTYVNLRYNLERLDLYCKVGQTKYFEEDAIGSGLNMIEGNTRTDVKLQMVYKF